MGNGTLTIRCGNADSCIAGAGDCFTGHVENAPGCNDSTCCHETCGLDQFCCDVTWDDYCASEATGLCTGNFPSCGPTSGDCGSAQSGPGCNNSACCNEICRSDPFCCLVSWDFDCVGEANGTCFLTCTAQSGSCFLSHGGPGCNDANCCQKVCGPPNNDTFCCDTQWDAQCASEAQGSGCVATQCGDGVVQGGEQCDDGNANDNDACTNACTIARCGDGIVQTGVEECDDGNLNNNDACTNSCVLARCGDGIVQSGVEQCDDSNANDNDACTNSCRVARCGDGIVESGIEECDDGNLINTDGCTNSCTLPRCGDGILQAGEQCDGASSESCGGGPCLPNCTCQPVVQSIPTMSHWAIALVGLVLLIGAKLRFRANMDMPIR
ncbi:MAG: DUF4215 domain-containing protein [Planctomycetes bacterium]|nr:DUF4215 domain-containing protein [Planctomycetota bacterium]MBI3832742.1 DUF4215 domain-containing protein [Planctomycetota bacterium]